MRLPIRDVAQCDRPLGGAHAALPPESPGRQHPDWNADEMTGELERNIGRDLQYIRFNGSLIGGLLGAAERFVGSRLDPIVGLAAIVRHVRRTSSRSPKRARNASRKRPAHPSLSALR